MNISRRPMTLAATVSLTVLGLTACSDDADTENTPTAQEESAEDDVAVEEEDEEDDAAGDDDADTDAADDGATEDEDGEDDAADDEDGEDDAAEDDEEGAAGGDEAGSGDLTAAPWAHPVTGDGDLLTTIELDDVTVEIYQVGVTQATKAGTWVDPDSNEPIIDEGDDIVFLNYVVTNHGDPIDLGSSLVGVDPRYDDWPYLQGMGSITDFELYEEMGVNSGGRAPGSMPDPAIFTLGSGESFSYGDNFHHQPSSPITFEAYYTPVDEEGDLIHDDKVEGEGTATIE